MSAITALGAPVTAALPAEAQSARTRKALGDFESLFIETLLQSTGMLKSLDADAGPEGGVASELMVREIAAQLAGQLRLDFGRSLHVKDTQ
jgi:hypothetical protein